jgi:hypothetical protein
MLSRFVLAIFLIAAVAGCRIEGDPQIEPLASSCRQVNFSCSAHEDCCSYGCIAGVCAANVVDGGVCRTSDDCSFTMTCVDGRCRAGAQCRPNAGDSCAWNNQCCSGNCVGESLSPPIDGSCAANAPPAVPVSGPFVEPFYSSTTLSASATDADAEDVLYYVWRLQSAPAGHGLGTWTSAAAHPTVFLAVPGTYVFEVTATDGPSTQSGRLSDAGSVTVSAVNLPPVVGAGADVASLLRSHSLVVSGTVFDPNLAATTVRCAWYATPPGEAELPAPLASYASCPPAPQATFTPDVDAAQGDWVLRLEASDGEFVVSDTRIVTVVNAAPVANACPGCAAPPYARVVNLAAPGAPSATIALSGTATDANLDVGTPGFAWSWSIVEQDGVPLAVPIVLAAGDGDAPPFAASFEPAAVGTYAANLHVDDGHGGSADARVVVHAEPWLRPLLPLDGANGLPRGAIADVAYHHGASAANDRIVFADSDGTLHRLWSLDPESSPTALVPNASLDAPPVALAVKPDGTEAVVAMSGSPQRWRTVSLGAFPAAGTLNPFGAGWTGTPTDLLYAIRMYAVSSTGAVHELGPSAASNTSVAALCDGGSCSATRGAFADGYLWLVNGSGELRRYLGRSNGNLELNPATAASGLTGTTDLWVSANDGGGRDVFAASGGIFDAATVTSVDALPYAAVHVDSAAPAGVRRGVLVRQGGTSVVTLDANWNESGQLRVPMVGFLGTGYPTQAVKAFVRSDGTAHYLVLRATGVAGPDRWYLVKR